MGAGNWFAKKVVEQRIHKSVEKEMGSKSLAELSKVLRATLMAAPTSKIALHNKVVSAIQGDLKRAIKKNPASTVDSLISVAANTPEYMDLLKDLDMDIETLKVLAQEALAQYAPTGARGG